MPESALWGALRHAAAMYGHFDRIENLTGAGMPDVTYCVRGAEGFIELKQIPRWPVNPLGIVRVPHYTPQQRIWHRQRCRAGGTVWVLLEVQHDPHSYLLLPADWARVHLGADATQQDCRAAARIYGEDHFPTRGLIGALTGVKSRT